MHQEMSFLLHKAESLQCKGDPGYSSHLHIPTLGCSSLVAGLGGELPSSQPPKHLCLFELVVQNVSADYSVPPGALEEAEIMKKY